MTSAALKLAASHARIRQVCASSGGKFLTFDLAGEEYGIAIQKVHEIIGMMTITWVPRTPEYVRGVINLRGRGIPIVDLRLRFGMASQEQTPETCIIVVTVQQVEIGIVVDRVLEVLNISDKDIEPAPSFGVEVNTDFILGIGKSQGKVRLLLDIDHVLTRSELMEDLPSAVGVHGATQVTCPDPSPK